MQSIERFVHPLRRLQVRKGPALRNIRDISPNQRSVHIEKQRSALRDIARFATRIPNTPISLVNHHYPLSMKRTPTQRAEPKALNEPLRAMP